MEKKETPRVGSKAPHFSLPATGGRTVGLHDYLGKKNLVLYFYPKDGTPGCTLEACGFRDAYARFLETDTIVIGVSTDDLESHERFSRKHELPFPLLSDPETEVASAYGVFGKKTFMGREFFGVNRTTFVIDKRGRIRRVYPRIKVREHTAEVLGFIRDELS